MGSIISRPSQKRTGVSVSVDGAIQKTDRGVEFKLNKDGSLTMYPTKNERGTKQFKHVEFAKSSRCPSKFEAVFDEKEAVIQKESYNDQCSFVEMAELCYAEHYPLLIKPEHIFLLILQGISVHVDQNAEKLRSKYVSHEGIFILIRFYILYLNQSYKLKVKRN